MIASVATTDCFRNRLLPPSNELLPTLSRSHPFADDEAYDTKSVCPLVFI